LTELLNNHHGSMAPYTAKGYYASYRPPVQQAGYSAYAGCTRCDNWCWAARLHDCGGKCTCGAWFGETRTKAASKGGGGSGGYGGGGKAGKAYWAGGGSKGQWASEASEEEKLAGLLGKLAGSAAVAAPELQAAMQVLLAALPQKEENSRPKWRDANQAHTAAQKAVAKGRASVYTRQEGIKTLEEQIEVEKQKLVQDKKDLEEAEGKEVEAARVVQELSTEQLARLAATEEDVELGDAGAKADKDDAVEASRAEFEAAGARYEAAKQEAADKKNKTAETAARVQTRAAEQAATGAVKRIRADGGNVSMEAEQETQDSVAPAQG
jgi:hypothetical protein